MKRVNALALRQSLGSVLDDLDAGGPILVEKARRPRAVLISLEDYRERFVDRIAAEERRALAAEMAGLRRPALLGETGVVDDLRSLRGLLP